MRRILLIIGVLWIVSCDSLLDVQPENTVAFTNYFETEQDLNTINVQMHSFLKTLNVLNDMHVIMGLPVDRYSSTTWANMNQLIPSAIVRSYLTNWRTHYNVIHFANLILDNIHRIKDLSQERKDFYLGQAYFVKAYVYFELARSWGNAVITKNSISQDMLGNSTAMEVLDEAIRNGELAEKTLGKYEDLTDFSGASLNTKQYGSKGAAVALLAHAYAWKGSVIELYELEGDAKVAYEAATGWATRLIEKKAGAYSLEETIESLCLNTMSGNGCENIFSLELDENSSQYPSSPSAARLFTNWPVNVLKGPGDWKDISMNIKASRVQEMYEKGDARRASFFYKLDSMAHDTMYKITEGYAYAFKWREGIYVNTAVNPRILTIKADYVIWRLADIYLLRAECYAKLNDDRAKDDLNEVRRRAKAKEFPAVGDGDIKTAIFKEREKELIFEGQRYYDAVRNNCLTEINPVYGTLTKQDIKDGVLYLPIHDEAFVMNDILRQNTYWFKYVN